MKRILSVMIMVMLLVVFTSCENKIEEPVVTDDFSITTLRIMHRWPPSTDVVGDIMFNVLNEFDEANPDIELVVDSVPPAMYEEQLTVRLASEQGPDVYIIWPGARIEAQVRKGDISDITELWVSNGWFDQFSESVISGSTHQDGVMYSLPVEIKPNTFWYNKQIFDELGLVEPDTWDELLEVAKQCKLSGYTPFAVGGHLTRWMPAFWFDFILLNTAGGDFREDLMWGRESWESEEVYRTFEIWKSLIDAGYFNEDANDIDSRQASRTVIEGQAAMMLQGPWASIYFTEDDASMEPMVDFGLFAFPVIDDSVEQAAQGAIIGWAINPDTKEEEAAKRLLEFLAREESMSYIAEQRNTLVSRKDISFDVYDVGMRVIMAELDQATGDNQFFMNFELATLPPMQEAGMEAFIDFYDNTDNYFELCEELERVSRETFGPLQ